MGRIHAPMLRKTVPKTAQLRQCIFRRRDADPQQQRIPELPYAVAKQPDPSLLQQMQHYRNLKPHHIKTDKNVPPRPDHANGQPGRNVLGYISIGRILFLCVYLKRICSRRKLVAVVKALDHLLGDVKRRIEIHSCILIEDGIIVVRCIVVYKEIVDRIL